MVFRTAKSGARTAIVGLTQHAVIMTDSARLGEVVEGAVNRAAHERCRRLIITIEIEPDSGRRKPNTKLA